jgi:hypothetical protein
LVADIKNFDRFGFNVGCGKIKHISSDKGIQSRLADAADNNGNFLGRHDQWELGGNRSINGESRLLLRLLRIPRREQSEVKITLTMDESLPSPADPRGPPRSGGFYLTRPDHCGYCGGTYLKKTVV